MAKNPRSDLQLIDFKAGEILFYEGDPGTFFFMIKSGSVEVFKFNEDNSEVSLATIDEGQAVGEFAMIDQNTRSASARAITDVTAVKVSEDGYKDILNDLPSWARSMMKSLVFRLRKANEIIQENEKITQEIKNRNTADEFSSSSEAHFDFDFSNLKLKND